MPENLVEAAAWVSAGRLQLQDSTGPPPPTVIFHEGDGQLSEWLTYHSYERFLELMEVGRSRSFDGGGDLLCLVSAAYRIDLALRPLRRHLHQHHRPPPVPDLLRLG